MLGKQPQHRCGYTAIGDSLHQPKNSQKPSGSSPESQGELLQGCVGEADTRQKFESMETPICHAFHLNPVSSCRNKHHAFACPVLRKQEIPNAARGSTEMLSQGHRAPLQGTTLTVLRDTGQLVWDAQSQVPAKINAGCCFLAKCPCQELLQAGETPLKRRLLSISKGVLAVGVISLWPRQIPYFQGKLHQFELVPNALRLVGGSTDLTWHKTTLQLVSPAVAIRVLHNNACPRFVFLTFC